MSLVTIPLAATELDWANWGLPMTNAVNDLDSRVTSVEEGTIGRVIARHVRTSTPSAATTEVNICYVAGSALAGHLYRVEVANFGVYGSPAGQLAVGHLRYTEDGSVPIATSSPVATGGSWTEYVANSSGYVPSTGGCCGWITPASNCTLTVSFTHRREIGSGDVRVYPSNSDNALMLTIIDVGTDPGSTGTDV